MHAYQLTDFFILHPWFERLLVFALVLIPGMALVQRLAYRGSARAFWMRTGRNPLAWVVLVGALMGAFSTPIPGTYTFNCVGSGTADTAEWNSALGSSANRFIVPVGTCSMNSTLSLGSAIWSNRTITGVDRYNSIVQAAAGSNLTTMFQGYSNGTASNFTLSNLTFDANYGNQTAGNGSAVFEFNGSITYNNIYVDGVRFLNCGAVSCLQFASSGVSEVDISNSYFKGSYCHDIYATKTTHMRIVGNIFTAYNQQVTADCAAISGYSQSGAALANWVIASNDFESTVSAEFAIEFVPATSVPANNIVIVGNTCNANATGGCGVSMACDACVVSGNTFGNGEYGDRNGCECSGNDLVISDNTIQNGQISLANNSTAYGSGGPSGMVVQGNTFQFTGAPAANGISAIQALQVNHVDILGNTVTINFSNTVDSYPVIAVGFYGSVGSTSYVRVLNNHISDQSATPNKQCIRLYENSSTFSTHVTIQGNTCEQMLYGLYFNTGTTYSTYVWACGNDVSTSTNQFNGAPNLASDSVGNFPCTVPFGTPQIGTGWGSGPTITGNSPAAFQVNVGSGGSASSGAVTLPAAKNGWVCNTTDAGNGTGQVISSSTTTSVTFSKLTAWPAGYVMNFACTAY
jgi:hypothetical protein